jgi:hypothetical protein
MRQSWLAAIGVLAPLLLLTPGMAQEPAAEAAFIALSEEDSASLVAAGRSDQANFERLRRRHLPSTWGGGSMKCDERIGRFCLNHMDGQDDWVAPPEADEVVTGRLTLIDGLNQAARLIPGDRWMAGQRVRYLLEARMFDEALVAARECRAERWWCAALAGFAYHHAARPVEADSAFVIALDAMDEEKRDTWTDLSFILDDRSMRVYRRLEGNERTALETRFWRLSDPLIARPGNELLAEHFSRQVWSELQDRAESPEGISWGYDLHEILVRFGWPAGWEQTRQFGMTEGRPPLVSHYSTAPQQLLPPPAAVLGEPATGTWDTEDARPRTGYNIPLPDSIARWVSPLAHQIAVFIRGDSAIVVAGYELPRDSFPDDVPIEAALALLPTGDPLLQPLATAADRTGRAGSLMLQAPAIRALVAIELLVPSEDRIARVRYGLELAPTPPDLLALSDLLLLEGGGELPDSLSAAAAMARGSVRVSPGEQLGIYWETYGVNPASTPTLTMSLRLLEPRKGWLRRLGERAGLLREAVPIRLRWEEAVTTAPYLPRSLHIEVPEVTPGDYLIELTVEAAGREPLTVQKEIEVWAL